MERMSGTEEAARVLFQVSSTTVYIVVQCMSTEILPGHSLWVLVDPAIPGAKPVYRLRPRGNLQDAGESDCLYSGTRWNASPPRFSRNATSFQLKRAALIGRDAGSAAAMRESALAFRVTATVGAPSGIMARRIYNGTRWNASLP